MIELLLQAERALAVGLLDQAERLYDQAADADPRNAIAIVGKARIAVERGNDAEALALARRALEIDPENAAARRLADRLVEVMAHRGETVPAAADTLATPAPATGSAPAAPAPAAPALASTAPSTDDPAASEPPRGRRPGLLRRLLRR